MLQHFDRASKYIPVLVKIAIFNYILVNWFSVECQEKYLMDGGVIQWSNSVETLNGKQAAPICVRKHCDT